jgi:hypothetical protein
VIAVTQRIDVMGRDGRKVLDFSNKRTRNVASVDFSQFAFGFSVSGAVVTVTKGKVRHGTRTPITVASADITIATDHAWLYVNYPLGTGAATIEQSETEPVSTEDVIKWPLTQWRLQGGAASVELPVRWVNDINLPGAFA